MPDNDKEGSQHTINHLKIQNIDGSKKMCYLEELPPTNVAVSVNIIRFGGIRSDRQ